ncbi:MAG: class I tRNA ligase family protein [Candidatus Heimdallarchaeota archaeon]
MKQLIVKEMKEEFEYFYPPDYRASAKELIFNHFTFYIFQHLALFPKGHYPLEIEANGMIMIEGDKMSKSGGNSLTLKDLIDRFGVDASRFGEAYAGEGYADASFRFADTEAAGKRLKQMFKELTEMKFSTEERRIDKWIISRLQRKISETYDHYMNQRTRSAIGSGFFDILNDLKWYENRGGKVKGPGYKTAILTLIDIMTPIVPHFAEEVNAIVRKEKTFAAFRSFPKANKKLIQIKMEDEEQLIKDVKVDIEGIFNAIKKQEKKSLKSIEIFIAPKWMYKVLKIRRGKPDNLIKAIMAEDDIKKAGNAAVKYAQKLTKHPGVDAKLNDKSEHEALTDAIDFFKREFKAKTVNVVFAAKADHPKAKVAEPGRPGLALTFEE